MKPLKTLALLLLLVPAVSTTQAKNKKPYKLPTMFDQARFVYVEAVDGQEFDPRLNPDDRQAIADVDRAIDDWKRYVLTTQRNEADLIFVVRKGRLAEARFGVQVGSRRQGAGGQPPGGPSAGNGAAAGGEVGPPDDLLEVYIRNSDDTLGALLWRHTRADGLNLPDLALFKELKMKWNRLTRTRPRASHLSPDASPVPWPPIREPSPSSGEASRKVPQKLH